MSTNFANFIDELRQARKMSREDLVDGIISLRQYYRFQKGENSLKSDVIEQLLNKLNMNHLTAYRYYFSKYNETNKKLSAVYPLIYNRKLKSASIALSEIDFQNLHYASQKEYYQILSLIIDSELNKTPYDLASQKIIELINYPELLNNEILAYHEIIGLVFITKKVLQENDTRLIKMSYSMINGNSNAENFLNYANKLPFYMNTSRALGHIKMYDESIAICKISEKEIFKNGDIVMLMYFYFVIALGYLNLENSKYKDYVRKVYMLLHIEDNPERTKEFTEKIEKVFMLKESDLIEYK